MNLKDFSLLKEDTENYTIGHPKGKSMTIPKAGLSSKAHELISKLKREQHLAEGGDVEEEPEQDTVDISPQVNQKIAAEDEQGANATPQSVPPAAPSSPTQPMAAAAPNATEGLQQAQKSIQAGVKAQRRAGQEEAQAQKDLATGITNLPSADEVWKANQTRDKGLFDSVMNKSIDPDRYLHNMSTGSKIASSIGLLLGGIGAGLSGGRNMAMDNLHKAINDDIEAQKNDQSKAMNLWKMNREATGDEIQANLATQNQMLNIAKAKIAQAQSGALGPIAQQNAAQSMLGIDQQIATNNWMRSRLSGNTAPGTESQHINEMQVMQQVNPAMYKEMESKYIPGVGTARIAVSPKDRETLVAFDEMEKALNDAKAFQQTQGGLESAIPGTELHKIAQSKANAIALAQNKLNGLNRLNETEYTAFKEAVNSVGGLRTQAAVGQLDELLNQTHRKQASVNSQLGISPFRKAASDQTAVAWAKANPNDPRAAQILQANGAAQGNQIAGVQ